MQKIITQTLRGTATMYIIVIMSILSVVLLGLITFVMSQVKYSLYHVSRAEALEIAEAGVHFYRWYLAHQTDGKTSGQITAFWANGSALGVGTPYTQTFADRGTYQITVEPPTSGQTSVTVTVVGWLTHKPDLTRTIRVRLRRPSWSEYAILSDADVRFGDGTTTYGPVHSNGGVRFDGVAYNKVTSARETYVDPDTGSTENGVWTSWTNEYNTNMNSDVFLAGYSYPVTAVDFEGVTADIALMRDEADANGISFNDAGQGQHIILYPNGTFEARMVVQYDSLSNDIVVEGNGTIYTIPDDNVIYVDDNIWVEGQIDDVRVSIVADDRTGATDPRIFLTNNLTYTNYDGSDVIGLVSVGDVETTRGSEDDLQIDAAIISQNGRIGRSYYGTFCIKYRGRRCRSYDTDYKSIITINGALASRGRYGFAWTDGTGYAARNLTYDNNLVYAPPPFFPTGTHYVPDLWEEL